MYSLHLTLMSEHTPGAVGSHVTAPGSKFGGSVPCSRTPQSCIEGGESAGYSLPHQQSLRTWDSNPQPLDYESDSLTIRPRLPYVMLNFSKSVLMKKQSHLHLGWPEGEYIFSTFSFLGELFLLTIFFFFQITIFVCLLIFNDNLFTSNHCFNVLISVVITSKSLCKLSLEQKIFVISK